MQGILSQETAWRTHDDVDSALLVDARDFYLAFFEAARRARRSILMLGWQFDSDVLLLRGEDARSRAHGSNVELLPFLDELCRTRPDLEIRILAWDYSLVFALERELAQKIVFEAQTTERFLFRWDDSVPLGGSHHQKLAVIDGRIAFLGSADICQSRWDASTHAVDDPLRTSRYGVRYKPYHEVQSIVTGAAARSCVDLFVERWRRAEDEELTSSTFLAPADVASTDSAVDVPATMSFPRGRVALARTLPESEDEGRIEEVRALLVRAIGDAEHLIYAETQYFTSSAVRDALLERMRDAARPKLDIVLIVPHKPEKLKEELTVALPQAELLFMLATEAADSGHALGVYNVAAKDAFGEDVFVYIHAKLMIIDDRFMTVGSANLTNRSMTLDSELNVVWEARRGAVDDDALAHAIKGARVRLLSEHVGIQGDELLRLVAEPVGLVARLDAEARSERPARGRLRRHELEHPAPGILARAVRDLVCEVLDPSDGAEPEASHP